MMLDAIAKAFQDGGDFMYMITLTSGFALAVILDRTWFLVVKYRADASRILEMVDESVRTGQVKQAHLEEIKPWLGSPVGKLARPVLTRADKPNRILRDRLFEAYLSVVPEVQVRTSMLGVIANVATLLGLLGTILGLIQAFQGVAAADPANKQAMLASGIAVAMNTTAYGLMVAIKCINSHSLLSTRMQTLLGEIESMRQRVLTILERRKDRRPA